MKKLLIVVSVAMAISMQSKAQKQIDYIVFYKPYTDTLETNHYTSGPIKFDFKVQYNNVKNANVNDEMSTALKHKDYRFIAISGYTYIYPGLQGYFLVDGKKVFGVPKRYQKYLDKYKSKAIMGTSDAINVNDPPLQDVAYNFAEKYNKILLQKIRTNQATK